MKRCLLLLLTTFSCLSMEVNKEREKKEQYLLECILNGDTNKVAKLLGEGVDPNTRKVTIYSRSDKKDDESALYLAIKFNHTQAALLLIQAGALLNSLELDHRYNLLHFGIAKSDSSRINEWKLILNTIIEESIHPLPRLYSTNRLGIPTLKVLCLRTLIKNTASILTGKKNFSHLQDTLTEEFLLTAVSDLPLQKQIQLLKEYAHNTDLKKACLNICLENHFRSLQNLLLQERGSHDRFVPGSRLKNMTPLKLAQHLGFENRIEPLLPFAKANNFRDLPSDTQQAIEKNWKERLGISDELIKDNKML